MAPKKPTVTSARRRAERASGSTKVAASTPQKRPTTTMQRPFQPGTRTSNMSGTTPMRGSAMRGAGSAALYTAASAALSPLARKAGTALGNKIKSAMTPKPAKKVADSFSGQYQKGKAAPSKAPKGQTKAKSFDNAFASARNSGMKTFVWEGKKYTTKMK